jgi:hypothetical protein
MRRQTSNPSLEREHLCAQATSNSGRCSGGFGLSAMHRRCTAAATTGCGATVFPAGTAAAAARDEAALSGRALSLELDPGALALDRLSVDLGGGALAALNSEAVRQPAAIAPPAIGI